MHKTYEFKMGQYLTNGRFVAYHFAFVKTDAGQEAAERMMRASNSLAPHLKVEGVRSWPTKKPDSAAVLWTDKPARLK